LLHLLPPKPKSEGGQFEPTIDSYSKRPMDTDAEYKVLSFIADTLEIFYDREVEGTLYLYTELQPCESCHNREDIKLCQLNTLNQISSAFWSSFP